MGLGSFCVGSVMIEDVLVLAEDWVKVSVRLLHGSSDERMDLILAWAPLSRKRGVFDRGVFRLISARWIIRTRSGTLKVLGAAKVRLASTWRLNACHHGIY